jgi:hypothetical protein
LTSGTGLSWCSEKEGWVRWLYRREFVGRSRGFGGRCLDEWLASLASLEEATGFKALLKSRCGGAGELHNVEL